MLVLTIASYDKQIHGDAWADLCTGILVPATYQKHMGRRRSSKISRNPTVAPMAIPTISLVDKSSSSSSSSTTRTNVITPKSASYCSTPSCSCECGREVDLYSMCKTAAVAKC